MRIINADVFEGLAQIESGSVHTCVTSPPYWALRDYGIDGQIGLESTPEEYVETMVRVFREVRRVLRDDGTLWLNLGDTYAESGKGRNADGSHKEGGKQGTNKGSIEGSLCKAKTVKGLKPKDLIGIPWMVAFALRADGWYLRQDIIWSKPNPMPESAKDRCTKSHEYIFLFSKAKRYYFDAESIAEPVADSTIARMNQDIEHQAGSNRVPGKTNGPMKAVVGKGNSKTFRGGGVYTGGRAFNNSEGYERQSTGNVPNEKGLRNKRSVWTISPQKYKGAHFATFPIELVRPCIIAGAPVGGTVLDPFFGSGTTGEAAQRLGRECIGIEINPAYCDLSFNRVSGLDKQIKGQVLMPFIEDQIELIL